ncbi:MAG: hypothetical protein PF961_12425 [Planctomycetota bacterium]|jgi:hypothetical protein|nr:hypothetical protein [Planctomycetota bacterium]
MIRLFVCALVLMAAACSSGNEVRKTPPPAAFNPEQFPDLPMPQGFIPKPGGDHLAVNMGGGAIRRYHVVLTQVDENTKLQGDELEIWYQRRLAARGWELSLDQWPSRQEWVKAGASGTERLVLETGRADRRTIIRLVLTPTDG